MFLRNFAEFNNFRVLSVDLRYHLIDLRIIPIDELSNCTTIDRLLHSLSTVLTYDTVCSLCKLCLVQSMDFSSSSRSSNFTCVNFVYIMDCLVTKGHVRKIIAVHVRTQTCSCSYMKLYVRA